MLVASFSIVGLQGCVPWRYSYERIQAPQAVYYRSFCRGTAGPPSVVYYPFHGIFISLRADFMSLGLHVPEGVTVQLNGDTVVIYGLTKNGPVDTVVRMEGFSRASLGNVPPDSRPLAEQFRLPSDFGQLQGATDHGHSVWYAFHLADQEQPTKRLWSILSSGELIRGTIKLPSMTVNGVRYEEQVLSFERAAYFDLFNPVNC